MSAFLGGEHVTLEFRDGTPAKRGIILQQDGTGVTIEHGDMAHNRRRVFYPMDRIAEIVNHGRPPR